ncbi:MAG: hypothetical protein J0L92_25005 [Deltaproteobacteria bacterium]|nr:hypothetical protein [Deltaproteobacteria bacterium]
MRCWSTPDPGVDAATPLDALVAPGTDARVTPGTDAFVSTGTDAFVAPGTDSFVSTGTDAYVEPSTDAFVTPGTDAWAADPDAYLVSAPDALVPPATDAGPLPDTGGPCGGGPLMTFYRDGDGDGHGAAASGTAMRCGPGGGFVASNDDCDDGNSTRFPGSPEICNNVDDDCNGTVDGAAANSACVVSNGTGVCRTGGVCDIGSCAPSFDDCDAVVANGCETDTRTTADHCGGCGLSCPAADTCGGSACADAAIMELAVGLDVSCIRRDNGRVACWGYNGRGALGDGTVSPRIQPITVPGITDAVDVDAGWGGVCAVRATGEILCWGGLGTGYPTAVTSPTAVPGIVDAVEVSVGQSSRCVRRASGRVQCWGYNSNGQLGNGTLVDSLTPVSVLGITNAVQLTWGGIDVGGDGFFCARLASGSVMCWGLSVGGQVGDGTTGRVATPTPVAVLSLPDAIWIDGGNGSAHALRAGGTAVRWGDGTGTPSAIAGISGWSSIGGSANTHICGMTTSGSVYCFGRNSFGGLGVGDTTDRASPTLVPGLSARSVGTGNYHSCALNVAGSVLCWGGNAYNQVGDGTSVTRLSPTVVRNL